MVLLISHSLLIPTNTSPPSPARWTMPNAISFDADFWRMHLWIANVPGYKKGAKKQALKKNRCSDGTELGTGFSSLVCKSCTGSSHLISSTDPRFNHLLDLTHFTTQAILKIPSGPRLAKISGSPRQTGSALVVTQWQRVLFVPRNWSHLKTNWRNVRIQMIWRRLELKIIYLLQQRSNDKT